MRSSVDTIRLMDRFGARNYSPLPVVITHAEGVWVEDPKAAGTWICLVHIQR